MNRSFVLTLFCFAPLFGFSQWQKNILPGNNDLYDVQIINNTAYIVGHNNSLYNQMI
ncbi:MAG: hypothetical protein R2852_00775 [Bacteroidia bacterium]